MTDTFYQQEHANQLRPKFWEHIPLLELNDAEWEALCDGCGNCCYRKFLDEDDLLYFTRIACNQLDLQTGHCQNYDCRFALEVDCTKLSKQNVADFSWLPPTCAYRLRFEEKPIPDWHPLLSKDQNSVKNSGVQICDGIHERDVDDWFDYVIETTESI